MELLPHFVICSLHVDRVIELLATVSLYVGSKHGRVLRAVRPGRSWTLSADFQPETTVLSTFETDTYVVLIPGN